MSHEPDRQRQTAMLLRRLPAFLLAATAVACQGNGAPPTGSATPPSAQPTPSTSPSSQATQVTQATQTPTPSGAARPDTYPDWLVGQAFRVYGSHGNASTLRRVGLPGRIDLPPGTHVLAVVEDRVMTVVPAEGSSVIRVLSFETGAEVARATVEGSGSGVPFPGGIVTDRLQVVSVEDGSVRQLHDPAENPDFEIALRVVAVSESGEHLATSVCQQGFEDVFGCRPTSIIDLATGELVGSIETGEMRVDRFTDAWYLARSFVSAAVFDADGEARWSTADLDANGSEQATLWHVDVLAGAIVATAQGIGGDREVLVRIEPLSGDYRVLFTEPHGEDWRFWTDWSTDSHVVLGHETWPGAGAEGCEPCPPEVLQAGVLDMATGTFDPDAIRIKLTP